MRLKAFGIDPMNSAMQGIVDQAFKLGGGRGGAGYLPWPSARPGPSRNCRGRILQLIERGVPVWQLLEQVTSRNTRRAAEALGSRQARP